MALKGQYLRMYLGDDSAFIAGAQSFTLNINVQTEDSSSKDTDFGWTHPEPVSISWDCSTDALVYDEDPVEGGNGSLLADMMGIALDPEGAIGIAIQFVLASGDNQRTKGDVIASGTATMTGLNVNAQNRQNGTYTASFQGEGALS